MINRLNCSFMWVVALLATAFTQEPPQGRGAITLPACTFNRGNGNVRVDLAGKSPWSDTADVLHSKTHAPTTVEYDFESPVAAAYTLQMLFAAAEARPLEVFVDGRRVASGCRGTTGGWLASNAAWEETCKLDLGNGKHTLKLSSARGFPHIVTLRLETPVAFPQGWSPARRATPPRFVVEVPPPVPYKPAVEPAALRRAIVDLAESFGSHYPRGGEFLQRLERIEKNKSDTELVTLHDEALLANPLLDFAELLIVKRRADSPSLGLPANYNCNVSLPAKGFDDEIVALSLRDPARPPRLLFRPRPAGFAGDVDLHFDADRLLFSMRDAKQYWQVCEVRADGTNFRMLTGEQPDVHSFDACYLPDGGIVFCSTAYFNAIACTGGPAGVLYRMDADGRNIRQLGFDQDQDWCPTVMNDGRVLYTRWEYTDTVHCHTRLLFRMNPDGTEQMEYSGSNSYWPNSFFYARPIPGHSTRVVSIIGGHHGVPRMGELLLFDPALGRREAAGAVQRIPGWGKKPQAVLKDQLVDQSWPRFLHPWPLSEKYFLVAAQPTPASLWGIYLVDVFDNLVLIKELPGFALLEPVPLRGRPKPPVVPSRVDLNEKLATVHISDIYHGPGLRDVPRGTVKSLRVLTYHYTFPGTRGVPGTLGIDGPWDIKRVLGTVPVEPDGSAQFRVPANTPVSIQPLDREGQALQLMRSWYSAMPGESITCAGCHESPNATPPTNPGSLALRKPPANLQPWYGAVRGFSFEREVQPVLDRYCTNCHNGRSSPEKPHLFDLRGTEQVRFHATLPGNASDKGEAAEFSASYTNLHPYVRRPGHESDYHLLEPMEFHASTTELVQLLRKGHSGVQLDAEAWDRLITWIDLNCPFYGTRHEVRSPRNIARRDQTAHDARRRRELLQRYAGLDDDPESLPGAGTGLYNNGKPLPAMVPEPPAKTESPAGTAAGWPFDSGEAAHRQREAGPVTRGTLDLAGGQTIELALIPAGEFVMGSTSGQDDERPVSRVRIERPFWMATKEITNAQYALFDPAHDSRVEDKPYTQYGIQGFPMNAPEQPVVRVSWNEAMAFCRWLSARTGKRLSLPTEAQWEYACRAGTATPFSFGGADADFSPWANLADAKLREFVTDVWSVFDPPKSPPAETEVYMLRDDRFNDGALLTVQPGRFRPNAWGLFDMHGNAAEWTRSLFRPYPISATGGRDVTDATGQRVVRGGSWRDRPQRCTSSFRLAYEPYQRVFNVGFRIACEDQDAIAQAEAGVFNSASALQPPTTP